MQGTKGKRAVRLSDPTEAPAVPQQLKGSHRAGFSSDAAQDLLNIHQCCRAVHLGDARNPLVAGVDTVGVVRLLRSRPARPASRYSDEDNMVACSRAEGRKE